jgi:predicted transcriptional regulator
MELESIRPGMVATLLAIECHDVLSVMAQEYLYTQRRPARDATALAMVSSQDGQYINPTGQLHAKSLTN